jgi:hypothetical protein
MVEGTNRKMKTAPPLPPLLKGEFSPSLFEREAGRDFKMAFSIWEKV